MGRLYLQSQTVNNLDRLRFIVTSFDTINLRLWYEGGKVK